MNPNIKAEATKDTAAANKSRRQKERPELWLWPLSFS
jgi:hypothetical protein